MCVSKITSIMLSLINDFPLFHVSLRCLGWVQKPVQLLYSLSIEDAWGQCDLTSVAGLQWFSFNHDRKKINRTSSTYLTLKVGIWPNKIAMFCATVYQTFSLSQSTGFGITWGFLYLKVFCWVVHGVSFELFWVKSAMWSFHGGSVLVYHCQFNLHLLIMPKLQLCVIQIIQQYQIYICRNKPKMISIKQW